MTTLTTPTTLAAASPHNWSLHRLQLLAPAPPPPPAPGCTAADLAQASGIVGTAMAQYMFSHPDVNNFFTSLRGLPNEELRGRVQAYMDANPQVETDINGIRQPVTDLRNRCDAPAPSSG